MADVGSLFYGGGGTQQPTAAMPTITPQLVIDNQIQMLQNAYAQREQQLQEQLKTGFVDQNKYVGQLQKMQQDFDEQYFTLQSKQEQIKQLFAMSDANLLEPDQVQETAWRSVLPKDVAAQMFPSYREYAPLSTGQLEKAGEEAAAYAKAAPKPRTYSKFNLGGYVGDLARGRATPQANLLTQYKKWRTYIGYDAQTPARKAQLDQLWDEQMAADDTYKWNPNSPQILSLRGRGRLSQAIGERVNKTPTNEADIISPFQQQLKQEVPSAAPQNLIKLDVITARSILQEAGGDKDRARQLAKSRGYTF